MAWLQIFQASELQAKARGFQIQNVQPLGIRRSIVDRNGRLVALDEQRFRLWAHPNNFHFLVTTLTHFVSLLKLLEDFQA